MSKVRFILIGSMKSGTTTLANHLKRHPEVYIPGFKEPQFFSRDEKYSRGIDWYESLFDEAGPHQICGEASTCYSRWPVYSNVPERILAYSPKMRFIYLVRDPAARAYSHYRHGVLKGEFNYASFQEAMDNNPEILCASMYMAQVNQYLACFPRDRFFFMRFEDLNNHQVIRDLFRFLGLEDVEKKIGHDIVSNTAGYSRVRKKILKKLIGIKNASGLGAVLHFCLSEKMRQNLLERVAELSASSFIGKKLIQKEQAAVKSLTEQERQNVYRVCAEDSRAFQQFTGLNLSQWFEKMKQK